MDVLANLFTDVFLHLDTTLTSKIDQYHNWIYVILFAIIFIETGLVVMPFLPGDSLLFAAGVCANTNAGSLNLGILLGLLSVAAVLGDTVNYWIGHAIGPKIFHKDNVRFMNRKHLDRAHAFYERYGGVTIILARFMPIIRTFAPFVAGIGKMSYWRFISFNVVGGLAWPALCIFSGVYFGEIEFVKKHFEAVVVMIVLISVLPIAFEYVRHRRESKAAA